MQVVLPFVQLVAVESDAWFDKDVMVSLVVDTAARDGNGAAVRAMAFRASGVA